jgi:hypothetical protein
MGARGRPNYPWSSMVEDLRARPGRWTLFPALTGVTPSVIDRIRRGTIRALRVSDGKIYARQGMKGWRAGEPIVDVYLSFVPTPPKENHADA